ncbi:MAG: acyltransferase [Thiotrichaceae bacterium]|nr:acyltransferase [Thiotrichaceae bacterium]
MKYRSEIDGLRAFAVVPVVLFHAGFTGLSGGFIGVDIFFVISGYLISSIILGELEKGTFTLTSFYERRARRILPALFFVLLVCLPFAWIYLFPSELIDFGKSLIAVPLFSSNFLFWQSSGYFAQDSESITLLHTWSLAVEEQFYVFFPLIMMVLWRFGTKVLFFFLAVIGVMSLAYTEIGWRNYPDANFFLIFSRAWELLIGVAVAFYLIFKRPSISLLTSQILSLIGLLAVVGSIVFLDKSYPFPSLYALIPTLGAAFIIAFCRSGTIVHSLLSNRVIVGIGLISYSTYLWHLPLFVYAKMILDEPSLPIMALLASLSLLLGFISWRFVEKPFRDKNNYTRKQIFIASLVGSFVFILIGASLVYMQGAEFRYE